MLPTRPTINKSLPTPKCRGFLTVFIQVASIAHLLFKNEIEEPVWIMSLACATPLRASMDTLSKSLVCAADVRTISFWLDLKLLTVFLDLSVHLRGVGETVYLSREIRGDGTGKLPHYSPTFASLHDRRTEPILHRTGYCIEISCSWELRWPNLVPSNQRTIPQVATSTALKICTSPLLILLKTKSRTVSMARLPSEELLVRLLRLEHPTLFDASSTSQPAHLHSALAILFRLVPTVDFLLHLYLTHVHKLHSYECVT
jgi:hypothetical protein